MDVFKDETQMPLAVSTPAVAPPGSFQETVFVGFLATTKTFRYR
jgi:hypothetical protein